jgi:hypothetical protein
MTKNIFYLLIFFLQFLTAQQGYPGAELNVYYHKYNPGMLTTQQLTAALVNIFLGNVNFVTIPNSAEAYAKIYIGEGKSEVIRKIGEPIRKEYSPYSMGAAGIETYYYDGLKLSFYDEESEIRYDMMTISKPSSRVKSFFSLSDKFNLYIDGAIPTEVKNYPHEKKRSGFLGNTLTYQWNIIARNGQRSDYFISIETKNEKITQIYVGPY